MSKFFTSLFVFTLVFLYAKEPKTVEYYKENPKMAIQKINMCEDPRRVYISDEDYIIGMEECENALEAFLLRNKQKESIKEAEEISKEGIREIEMDFGKRIAYAQEYVQNNLEDITNRVIKSLDFSNEAKQSGKSGIVEVTFIIDTNGRMKKASISKSSNLSKIDEDVIKAVDKLKDEIFSKPEIEVTTIVTVPFDFKR